MDSRLEILSETPLTVCASTSTTQPQARDLSAQEIRICFPTLVVVQKNGTSVLTLDDAPIIGLLLEIAECLCRLDQGFQSAEAVDFYGEYKLVFRRINGRIRWLNEFDGLEFEAQYDELKVAVQRWARSVFEGIEMRFTDILMNENYQQTRSIISSLLRGG